MQIFDNTPAAKEGTLQAGDEIIGVDNVSVKGKTKTEVAKMIQSSQGFVLFYFKFHLLASKIKIICNLDRLRFGTTNYTPIQSKGKHWI